MIEFIWILLTLLVAVGYSVTMFIDNYQADVTFHGRLPEAVKPLGTMTYLMMIAVLLLIGNLNFGLLSWGLIAILVFAGLIDALASVPYYKALKYEETTGLEVLNQLTPVIALIVGIFILGENITVTHIFALLFILLAAIFIVLSNGKSKINLAKRAVFLMLIAIVTWVASDTIFIYFVKDAQEIFLESFCLLLIGKAIGDATLFGIKSWRKRLSDVWREKRWRFLSIFIANEFIYSVTECLWRYVLILAPTFALASVVENISQLIIVFLLGVLLSKIWPKFGREKLTRRVVMMHLVAVVMAISGILLFYLADNMADSNDYLFNNSIVLEAESQNI